MKTTFITWYPSCRRSDTIASKLGGRSYLIHFLRFKQPLFAAPKYIAQTFSTLRILIKERPDVVFVASPPVFAVAVVSLYCLLTRCRYIIDAHTGMFDDPRWTWLLPLTKFQARHAICTIVTNKYLKRTVDSWDAKTIVIADVPVVFPETGESNLGDGKHVVVVNTFSQDEPINEILEAATKLPSVNFHITGNIKHSRHSELAAPSKNVKYTGWVTDEEYAGLLRSANVVMCLTTNDHTMQRGGYEAMALGKPLVTSSWDVLRETFSSGTIHTDNTADHIASSILDAIERQPELEQQMTELAKTRKLIFQEKLDQLKQLFNYDQNQ